MKSRSAKTPVTESSDIDSGDSQRANELGPESAGQSGDMQGLDDSENGESEEVNELLEDGQYFEASVVSGIEDAPPADVSEVRTRQFPEDDVPGEYLDEVEFRK
jgi:hypothetical protein